MTIMVQYIYIYSLSSKKFQLYEAVTKYCLLSKTIKVDDDLLLLYYEFVDNANRKPKNLTLFYRVQQ